MFLSFALVAALLAVDGASQQAVENPQIEMVGKVPKIYGVVVPDAHLATARNPVVCKVITKTGSRTPSKVCYLKSYWTEMERISQDATMNYQRMAPLSPSG